MKVLRLALLLATCTTAFQQRSLPVRRPVKQAEVAPLKLFETGLMLGVSFLCFSQSKGDKEGSDASSGSPYYLKDIKTAVELEPRPPETPPTFLQPTSDDDDLSDLLAEVEDALSASQVANESLEQIAARNETIPSSNGVSNDGDMDELLAQVADALDESEQASRKADLISLEEEAANGASSPTAESNGFEPEYFGKKRRSKKKSRSEKPKRGFGVVARAADSSIENEIPEAVAEETAVEEPEPALSYFATTVETPAGNLPSPEKSLDGEPAAAEAHLDTAESAPVFDSSSKSKRASFESTLLQVAGELTASELAVLLDKDISDIASSSKTELLAEIAGALGKEEVAELLGDRLKEVPTEISEESEAPKVMAGEPTSSLYHWDEKLDNVPFFSLGWYVTVDALEKMSSEKLPDVSTSPVADAAAALATARVAALATPSAPDTNKVVIDDAALEALLKPPTNASATETPNDSGLSSDQDESEKPASAFDFVVDSVQHALLEQTEEEARSLEAAASDEVPAAAIEDSPQALFSDRSANAADVVAPVEATSVADLPANAADLLAGYSVAAERQEASSADIADAPIPEEPKAVAPVEFSPANDVMESDAPEIVDAGETQGTEILGETTLPNGVNEEFHPQPEPVAETPSEDGVNVAIAGDIVEEAELGVTTPEPNGVGGELDPQHEPAAETPSADGVNVAIAGDIVEEAELDVTTPEPNGVGGKLDPQHEPAAETPTVITTDEATGTVAGDVVEEAMLGVVASEPNTGSIEEELAPELELSAETPSEFTTADEADGGVAGDSAEETAVDAVASEPNGTSEFSADRNGDLSDISSQDDTELGVALAAFPNDEPGTFAQAANDQPMIANDEASIEDFSPQQPAAARRKTYLSPDNFDDDGYENSQTVKSTVTEDFSNANGFEATNGLQNEAGPAEEELVVVMNDAANYPDDSGSAAPNGISQDGMVDPDPVVYSSSTIPESSDTFDDNTELETENGGGVAVAEKVVPPAYDLRGEKFKFVSLPISAFLPGGFVTPESIGVGHLCEFPEGYLERAPQDGFLTGMLILSENAPMIANWLATTQPAAVSADLLDKTMNMKTDFHNQRILFELDDVDEAFAFEEGKLKNSGLHFVGVQVSESEEPTGFWLLHDDGNP